MTGILKTMLRDGNEVLLIALAPGTAFHIPLFCSGSTSPQNPSAIISMLSNNQANN
jgi:hypothetical protein